MGRSLDNLIGGTNDPALQRLETADSFDTRPFEIWIYTRQGRPLFPERELDTPQDGLQFIFVDETGTGSYRLRYGAEDINY